MFNLLYDIFVKNNTITAFCYFIFATLIIKTFNKSKGNDVFRAWLLLIAHIILLLTSFILESFNQRLFHGFELVASFLIVLAVINLSSILIFKVIFPKINLHLPAILNDLVTAGASIISFFILASSAGYNISGLIATSAVITAVIGFSLQDTLINIMGGLSLQVDNSIKVGDWIKFDEKTSGKVKEVRWRHTAIETRNWETIIIPNSIMTKSQITILGKREDQPVQWRRWIYFNVDFRYSPDHVIKEVETKLRKQSIKNVALDPPINCIVMDFTDSYARYAVRYWLTDLVADDPTDSEVRLWIYTALKRSGIPLSMPAHAVFVTQDDDDRKERKSQAELKERMQFLEKVDLFKDLPINEVSKLALRLIPSPFRKNEVITKQGSDAHWLYLIKRGIVSINISSNESQEEVEVARLTDYNYFGEMSLMTGSKRSATVSAYVDTDCYKLDKIAFQDILNERPEIAEMIAEVLAKRKAGLEKAKEGFTHEEHQVKIEIHKTDILSKIRDFFGINS